MEEKPEEYIADFSTENLPEEEGKEDIWFRSEMFKAIEKIVEDKLVEQKLQDFPLWCGNTKTMKLTFFDEEDKVVLLNLYEAEICRYLRSLPPNKQNFQTYLQLGQARMVFYANLKRSIGTPVQKINERIAILSQWKISTPMEIQGEQPKLSIWRRLFG